VLRLDVFRFVPCSSVTGIGSRLKGGGIPFEGGRLGVVQEQNFLNRGLSAVHATTMIETENSAFGQRSNSRTGQVSLLLVQEWDKPGEGAKAARSPRRLTDRGVIDTGHDDAKTSNANY